jgi:hypothetical protein
MILPTTYCYRKNIPVKWSYPNYVNVLEILVLPHRILNMFCHSHLCTKYVQGLFYDYSESTCEIVPCCLTVPPLYLPFKWEHNKDDNLKKPNPKGKSKWENIDKDLYRVMVTEKSTALYERMRITTISSQEAITQESTLLTSAAQICSR